MGIFHSILLLIIFITFTYKSGPEVGDMHPYENYEEEIDPRFEEVQFEEEPIDPYEEDAYYEEEEIPYQEDYSEEQVSEI